MLLNYRKPILTGFHALKIAERWPTSVRFSDFKKIKYPDKTTLADRMVSVTHSLLNVAKFKELAEEDKRCLQQVICNPEFSRHVLPRINGQEWLNTVGEHNDYAIKIAASTSIQQKIAAQPRSWLEIFGFNRTAAREKKFLLEFIKQDRFDQAEAELIANTPEYWKVIETFLSSSKDTQIDLAQKSEHFANKINAKRFDGLLNTESKVLQSIYIKELRNRIVADTSHEILADIVHWAADCFIQDSSGPQLGLAFLDAQSPEKNKKLKFILDVLIDLHESHQTADKAKDGLNYKIGLALTNLPRDEQLSKSIKNLCYACINQAAYKTNQEILIRCKDEELKKDCRLADGKQEEFQWTNLTALYKCRKDGSFSREPGSLTDPAGSPCPDVRAASNATSRATTPGVLATLKSSLPKSPAPIPVVGSLPVSPPTVLVSAATSLPPSPLPAVPGSLPTSPSLVPGQVSSTSLPPSPPAVAVGQTSSTSLPASPPQISASADVTQKEPTSRRLSFSKN